MEITDSSGINIKINEEDLTASVIKSPEANGEVFIPKIISHEEKEYKIISIDEEAFSENKIDSLTFAADSEVTILKKDAFLKTSIKKLQIPKSLKKIESGCFFLVTDLTEIEVAPGNRYFSYVDDKYLVYKSSLKNPNYETLCYGRFDLEEAEIPSYVKTLQRHCFNFHLKSIVFPDDSELETIEYGVLNKSMTKLTIPKNLKKIDQNNFQNTPNLAEVEIKEGNKMFSFVDNKYLLTKSSESSEIFDQLIFCRRDVKDAIVPKDTKTICAYSFSRCSQLKSLTFPSNGSLELIDNYAFSFDNQLEKITVPETVKIIGSSAFSNMKSLKNFSVIGDKIQIEDCVFQNSDGLTVIDLTKPSEVFLDGPIPKGAKVVVRRGINLQGDVIEENPDCFQYEGEVANNEQQIVEEEEEPESETQKSEVDKNRIISMPLREFMKIVRHVQFVEERLERFEDFDKFNFDKYLNKETEEEEEAAQLAGNEEEEKKDGNDGDTQNADDNKPEGDAQNNENKPEGEVQNAGN